MAWLSAIALAGCSLTAAQPRADLQPPPPLAGEFFDPQTGTTYRLPTRAVLATRHAPRIVLAQAPSGGLDIPAAVALGAPPPQAHSVPTGTPAAVVAAPPPAAAPSALRLDHELASISRMVPFASSRSGLGPKGRQAVNELLPIAHEARQVVVRGRTDALGKPSSNRALAEARAQTVASAFVAAGVSRDKISTHQCVDCFVASNATAAGRRLNRRVDVEMNLPKARIAQLPRPVHALETPPLILARTLTPVSDTARH
ncbi:OmpA family protein [Denitromonas iodatirespirans]|uniref:OmpA family protein n=1 Tax=Denitromonas iodatirespirans TaxID=2795389 RepID=A0A944HF75_DENI1|nr:OmpA family protein [Denitromonas iodatirespirans]MBT0963491.1 OmpA family protein [Denitromonas iodatirespirans]